MTTTFDRTTVIGMIRGLCADDQPDPAGILPDGKNITDEQLLAMYSREGSNTGRAAAAALEYASQRWSILPSFEKMGAMAVSRQGTIQALNRHATQLRRQYGRATETPSRTSGGKATFSY